MPASVATPPLAVWARIDPLLTAYKPAILLLQLGANDGLRGLSPLK